MNFWDFASQHEAAAVIMVFMMVPASVILACAVGGVFRRGKNDSKRND